jgi:hypothetical protein
MRRYALIPLIALVLALAGWDPPIARAACGSTTKTSALGLFKIVGAKSWWECLDDNAETLDTKLAIELVSSTATSATSTTLTDTTQNWSTDLWADKVVKITGGTGSGQSRSISSNTANTLTVSSAWTTTPDATSNYKVLAIGGVSDHGQLAGLGDDDHAQYHNDTRGDARYYTKTQLDAGQLDGQYFQESEFLGTSAGAGDAGKPIKLDAAGHVDATMINDADVDHGSIGGLADDDHTQYHNDARGDARYLKLAGGTMTGLLTLSGDPSGDLQAATKQYVDATSAVLDSGTATSGTSTTLTDTSKSWGTDVWVGNKVSITGGTGAGQTRSISSNTATVLTVSSAWTTNPDATSTYNILGGGVSDHGALTGLADDDHTQYHNDARGDARYLKLAGGTMTGKITLDGDPTANLHASTKQYVDAVKAGAIAFIIDGGGSAITTGEKGHLRVPFACTINRATALADQSGSVTVDVWKDTYANFSPTDADSITASAPVTITSAQKSEDSTLTGWTTSVAADDILAYNVDSATTITRVTVSLKCTKN